VSKRPLGRNCLRFVKLSDEQGCSPKETTTAGRAHPYVGWKTASGEPGVVQEGGKALSKGENLSIGEENERSAKGITLLQPVIEEEKNHSFDSFKGETLGLRKSFGYAPGCEWKESFLQKGSIRRRGRRRKKRTEGCQGGGGS